MSGAHGREYLNNRLKERGGVHPGLHPGTGEGGQARARMTPPIRTADVSNRNIITIIIIVIVIVIITITIIIMFISGPNTRYESRDGRVGSTNTTGERSGSHRVSDAGLHCRYHHPLRVHSHEGINIDIKQY